MQGILSTLDTYENTHTNSIGYIYAVIGNSCMTLMQVCAKHLSVYMVTSQFLLYRAFFLTLLNTAIISLSGHQLGVTKHRIWRIICLRMFISGFVVYLQFLPLKYMPISILNSIRMTLPIITHFMEALMMNTKLHKKDLLVTCASFLGIIFMVKPPFLFGTKDNTVSVPMFYASLALLGTFFLSIQSILVRKLKDDITNDVLVEYFYVSQIYINSLTLLVFEMDSYDTLPWVPNNYLVFVLLIVFGYAGQILNTRSLFIIPASKAMPFRYINVIMGFLIDTFYYSLSFDWMSLLGILITSISLAYLTLHKTNETSTEGS